MESDDAGPAGGRGVISIEAASALIVAFINLALDQADIHIMWISWISVAACIVLGVDILRRIRWTSHPQYGKRRLWIGSTGVLTAFLAFGVFLSLHTRAERKTASPNPHANAMPTPGPLPSSPPNLRESKKGATEGSARELETLEKRTPAKERPSESKPGGARNASPSAPTGGTSIGGGVVVNPGGVASFGQQGGITAGQVQINPLPLEKTWQISIAKCDEWVKKLDALGPTKVSVGAFISNNDGSRVVGLLAACFNRSTWTAQTAVLPSSPDGVEIGAAEAGPKLDAIESGLLSLGLRVMKRDIRPAYGDELGIVIGTNPIKQQP